MVARIKAAEQLVLGTQQSIKYPESVKDRFIVHALREKYMVENAQRRLSQAEKELAVISDRITSLLDKELPEQSSAYLTTSEHASIVGANSYQEKDLVTIVQKLQVRLQNTWELRLAQDKITEIVDFMVKNGLVSKGDAQDLIDDSIVYAECDPLRVHQTGGA